MKPIKVSTDSGIVTVHSATIYQDANFSTSGVYMVVIDAQFSEHRKELRRNLNDKPLFSLLHSMESDEDRASHICRTYLAIQMIEEWVAKLPEMEEGKVADEIEQYFGGISNVDRFMANTGISSDKKGQVLEILMSAENKRKRTEDIDAIIEETSKKLAAL